MTGTRQDPPAQLRQPDPIPKRKSFGSSSTADGCTETETVNFRRMRLGAAGLLLSLFAVVCAYQVLVAYRIVKLNGFLGAADARSYIIVFAVGVGVVVTLTAVLPRAQIWLGAAIACVCACASLAGTAIAGRQAWPIVVAVLTVSAMWILGDISIRIIYSRSKGAPRLHFLVPVATGFGLLGLAVVALGRVGLLNWWALGIPVVVVGTAGIFVAARRTVPKVGDTWERLQNQRFALGVLAILLWMLGWALVWAAAPDLNYDSLYAKEWLPSVWARTGEMRTMVDHPIMATTGLTTAVAVPGHTLGAPAVGRFLQLLIGVLITAGVWSWAARERDDTVVPAAAAFVFAITPQVIWQMSTAYDDLLLTMMAVGTAAAAMAIGRRAPLASGLLVGFVAGAALASKSHLLFFAVGTAVIWLLAQIEVKRIGASVWRLLGLGIGAGVTLLPVILRWVDTGNPLYPLYNAVFESPYFPPVDASFNMPYWKVGFVEGAIRVPWKIIANPSTLMEAVPPGVFGLLVPVLIVAVLAGWAVPRRFRIAWFSLIVGLAGWWLLFRYLRYLLPLAAVAILLVAVVFPRLRGSLPRHLDRLALGCAALASVLFFVSTVATFWNVPGHVPVDVAFGRESTRAYEHRAIVDDPVIQAFNKDARDGDIAVTQAPFRTLLKPGLDMTPFWELATAMELRGGVPSDDEQLYELVTSLGVRWVILADAGRLPDNMDGWVRRLIDSHGEVAFAGRNRVLYELVPKPAPEIDIALCDRGESQDTRCVHTGDEPFARDVAICAGTTYGLHVKTGSGESDTNISLHFPNPDATIGHDSLAVGPLMAADVFGTAPQGATTAIVSIAPSTANVEDALLFATSPPLC